MDSSAEENLSIMTDGIWEPLAELELNLHGIKKYPIHCLCSRTFIRSKSLANALGDSKDSEKDLESETPLKAKDDEHDLVKTNEKKKEVESLSCYCSASYYSTDDYESVIVSTSDQCHANMNKGQPQLYPLQSSDSGADLSENCTDKHSSKVDIKNHHGLVDLDCAIFKSNLDIAWEKYWSTNGENIIWKSWIEKYGAYINPSYLEQNNLNEMFDMEIDDLCKQETANSVQNPNVVNGAEISGTTINNEMSIENSKYFNSDSIEKIPDLKISSYLSCGNLSEAEESLNPSGNGKELEAEDNLLKSSSFGSYETYERDKHSNIDEDQIKTFEHERVRSRCSNTNLSVKSIANTTVTTDSMTNVTKITLSSLDLSCECESVPSSSLSSTSSDDSSELSSSSSSSSKEEMCTEADAWWRRLWKEHYEQQYTSTYRLFTENFDLNDDTYDAEKELTVKDTTVIPDSEESKNDSVQKVAAANAEKGKEENILESYQYLNSVSHVLKRLENIKSDFSQECDENAESETMKPAQEESVSENGPSSCTSPKCVPLVRTDVATDGAKRKLILSNCDRQSSSERDFTAKERKPVKRLENIKQALSLMGFSYRINDDSLKSGHVTFKKKNIRAQNRRLKLADTKPALHIFFDDDGNEMLESKPSESASALEFQEEEPTSSKGETEDIMRINHSFIEKESLGYEAHSSSVDEDMKMGDENKMQKKKRKRQRKNNVPLEVAENKNLMKYWLRRYQLFSKFDGGIKLDAESWYSVTPERVAMHHAERCRCDLIIDAFCGAGGNAIQFAFTCERVIAIDIDPEKIQIAKNNARVYGVEDRIEFIVGDFTKLALKLQSDVVFLSPPWGGPKYSNADVYNLENILPPLGGAKLYCLASNITPEVAYFLPKNINSTELAILPGPGGEVEIEQNFLGRKLTSITAYFGELIRDPEDAYFDGA